MSDWNGEGYDAQTSQTSGLYCRLKQKGQKVRLRLVSSCYRYTDVLTKDGVRKELRKTAWIAILKELVDNKPVKRVVVFQSSPMVYGAVKDLNESPDWGDPTHYDIEVTRTEMDGKYYVVVPLPKPMGPISEDDAALVLASGINLVEACKPKDGQQPEHSDESGYVDPFDN